MSDLHVRPATEDDLHAILEIYNVSVLETTSAWSDTPQTLAARTAWFAVRQERGDGVYVAEEDGEVIGFAAYGDFRDTTHWPGYRFTCENTVHLRVAAHGRGIGSTLMERLIQHATDAGKHVMVAAVDGGNDGSLIFHERLGFREVGRLSEVGWKFERWLDVVFLQLPLSPADAP